MNNEGNRSRWIAILWFLLQMFSLNGQHVKTSREPSSLFHTLLFSFDYTTNSNILSNINREIRQPSLSPGIAFLSKWGADLLVSGSFIDNSDDSLNSFTEELDFLLGYNLKPHKNLTIYPSYNRFVYSNNTSFFNSVFNSDLRLDIDFNYRFLGIGLSSGYLMGKQQTFYASVRNYYLLNFNKVFSKQGSLTIQPGVDANFGNYEFLNMLYLDQLRQYPGFYRTVFQNSPSLQKYVFSVWSRNPDMTYKEIIDDLLENQAEDSFKLTSLNFSLPLFYMIGNFGVNLGLFVSVPVKPPDYLSDDALFYFNIGISYSL